MESKKPSLYYGADVIIFEHAKKLRENMTTAEGLLWNRLLKNQLGVRFKPQHPISNYIVDFYCHKAKLVIEVDGDIHFNEEKQKQDAIRASEIEACGLKILRFTNEEIFKNLPDVIDQIKLVISTHS